MISIDPVVERVRRAELVLHVPRMTVHRVGHDPVLASGLIHQNRAGEFQIRAYVEDQARGMSFFSDHDHLERSPFAEDRASVDAEDAEGRSWRFDSPTLLWVQWHSPTSIEVLFSADTAAIVGNSGPEEIRKYCTIAFPADLDISTAEYGKLTLTRPNGGLARQKTWPSQRVDIGVMRGEFQRHEEHWEACFSLPPKVSPTRLAESLAAALTFAAGVDTAWTVIEHGTDLFLRGTARPRAAPIWCVPIGNLRDTSLRDAWWRLVGAFASMAAEESSPVSDILSRLPRQITSAAHTSPEALASTLTFAVEQLASNMEAPVLESMPSDLQTAVARFRLQLRDLRIDERWRSRASGLLDQLDAPPRPKDLLVQMEVRGLIGREHPTQWNRLRQAVAHRNHKQRPDEDWLDLSAPVATCLHRLVLAAIGYVGPYRDYGQPGWPIVGGAGQH